MGRAPTNLAVVLLYAAVSVFALDATQVGNVDAGIDIRIPLDAFQCVEWPIYYKIEPTQQGQDLGVDYTAQKLLLTTADDARTPIVTINLPQGEGVLSWRMNLKSGTQFFVAPHGLIFQGDIVEVKLGNAGNACLGLPTQTMHDTYVTYDGPAFDSQQAGRYHPTTNFINQRTTSPSANLETHWVPEGVIVTPATSSPTATDSQGLSGSQSSPLPTASITSPPTTITSSPQGQASHMTSSRLAAIIGGTVGGVVLLIIVVILAVLLCVRRRRSEEANREGLILKMTNSDTSVPATLCSLMSPIYEPQARIGRSAAPTIRYHHDGTIDSDRDRRESKAIPKDLERALAVVVDHVRRVEDADTRAANRKSAYRATVVDVSDES